MLAWLKRAFRSETKPKVYPLFPGVVALNAMLSDNKPELWDRVRGATPYMAAREIAAELGFEFVPTCSVGAFTLQVAEALDVDVRDYLPEMML